MVESKKRGLRPSEDSTLAKGTMGPMMTRQHAAPSFSFKIRGARHGPLDAGINLRLPAL